MTMNPMKTGASLTLRCIKLIVEKSPFTEEPVQMGHPKNIGNWLLYIGDHNEEIQCALAISGKWWVRTSCQKQSKITFK